MNDLENRVATLENELINLHFQLHASTIALTVLSTVVSSLGGDKELLRNTFRENLEARGEMNFAFPTDDDYQERIKERVLNLL